MNVSVLAQLAALKGAQKNTPSFRQLSGDETLYLRLKIDLAVGSVA